MQKIVAFLWFDNQAEEAANLAQWSDFGVSFNLKRALANSADVRGLNATQTVIAQLR